VTLAHADSLNVAADAQTNSRLATLKGGSYPVMTVCNAMTCNLQSGAVFPSFAGFDLSPLSDTATVDRAAIQEGGGDGRRRRVRIRAHGEMASPAKLAFIPKKSADDVVAPATDDLWIWNRDTLQFDLSVAAPSDKSGREVRYGHGRVNSKRATEPAALGRRSDDEAVVGVEAVPDAPDRQDAKRPNAPRVPKPAEKGGLS